MTFHPYDVSEVLTSLKPFMSLILKAFRKLFWKKCAFAPHKPHSMVFNYRWCFVKFLWCEKHPL